MTKLVDEVRGRGVKTGILDQQCQRVERLERKIPIEAFDAVVDSCEVGMRKPEPEIYQLICKKLSLMPSSRLFLDDHPANVEAAVAVGLDALLVTGDFDAAVSEVLSVSNRRSSRTGSPPPSRIVRSARSMSAP